MIDRVWIDRNILDIFRRIGIGIEEEEYDGYLEPDDYTYLQYKLSIGYKDIWLRFGLNGDTDRSWFEIYDDEGIVGGGVLNMDDISDILLMALMELLCDWEECA